MVSWWPLKRIMFSGSGAAFLHNGESESSCNVHLFFQLLPRYFIFMIWLSSHPWYSLSYQRLHQYQTVPRFCYFTITNGFTHRIPIAIWAWWLARLNQHGVIIIFSIGVVIRRKDWQEWIEFEAIVLVVCVSLPREMISCSTFFNANVILVDAAQIGFAVRPFHFSKGAW